MTDPSWNDLEKPVGNEIDPNSLKAVLARIGETEDGLLLRKVLLKTKIETALPRGATDSALRDDAADRRIALTIYRLLERKLDPT